MARQKAIGIVRVSQVGDREGESFASPREQRERIEAACESEGLSLAEVVEELDVSGGKPLSQRDGLRRAIEAVEAGQVQAIVGAYLDRLARSLRVQDELVSRVEQAGGRVFAVDVGSVTNRSAGQWLSSTLLGAVSEYQRRSVGERSRNGQAKAIQRGALPFRHVPVGYQRKAVAKGHPDHGKIEPDPDAAPVVAEAFRMRAAGESISTIRDYMRSSGVERSFHAVGEMFTSRAYRGEIHFGDYTPNLSAHEAIIDERTWQQVQRVRVSRGRPAKSNRLLARLGVLRCATCGARMVVGRSNSVNAAYRCPATGDCQHRASIKAETVEREVVKHVKAALSDVKGRASVEGHARKAEEALDAAQADLDAALRSFTANGLEGETAARERLAELRSIRDAAQAQVDQLPTQAPVLEISGDEDWERLSLSGQRDLIRATISRVTVAPGRGADRVTVEFVS